MKNYLQEEFYTHRHYFKNSVNKPVVCDHFYNSEQLLWDVNAISVQHVLYIHPDNTEQLYMIGNFDY
mgnify:CR=1 FL=1